MFICGFEYLFTERTSQIIGHLKTRKLSYQTKCNNYQTVILNALKVRDRKWVNSIMNTLNLGHSKFNTKVFKTTLHF